ncbi:hypothetical protein J2S55_003696 [Streptosporangium brasiliense]|uniref:Uncharacterized protein n=1 Tax=Streptosporangium brasiliense TaxID=47480 RepID=A0ABT9R7P0_9ACTN|nr:hypothetical protein [Streptosporangium brasiliense]
MGVGLDVGVPVGVGLDVGVGVGVAVPVRVGDGVSDEDGVDEPISDMAFLLVDTPYRAVAQARDTEIPILPTLTVGIVYFVAAGHGS